MPMYWGSMTNQNSTNQNSDALDRACKLLCNIPEGLFRDFAVPAGMDRDLAIHIIMREHGLAPLYRPDPYWMVDAIRYWVQESMPIWEKLYSTTQLKYNPIWNTDVQERTTDIRTTDRDTTQDRTAVNRGKSGQTVGQVTTGDYHETGSTELHDETAGTGHTETEGKAITDDTSTTTTTNKTEVAGTDKKTTESTKKLDQTVTRDISPENAPDYQPDDQTHTVAEETFKSTENGEHKETTDFAGTSATVANSTTNTTGTSDTETHGHENQTTGSQTDGTTKGTTDTKTQAHDIRHEDAKEVGKEKVTDTYNHGWIKQGNIGVTTTQQMIDAERETVLFDVYMTIANDYHAKFCLDVY